jgi:hypothetical protein
MRTQDLRTRNPSIDQRPEPLPSHLAPLAATDARGTSARSPEPKGVLTIHIAGHRMVVEVALYDRLVPAPPKLLLQLTELRRESLTNRLPPHNEPAGRPGRPTQVRETQKVKHLRLALASLRGGLCIAGETSASALRSRLFRSSIPCLHVPLSTLRWQPYGWPHMTRGQDGSLLCLSWLFHSQLHAGLSRRTQQPVRVAAISSPRASDAVAPGLGAFTTCSSPGPWTK